MTVKTSCESVFRHPDLGLSFPEQETGGFEEMVAVLCRIRLLVQCDEYDEAVGSSVPVDSASCQRIRLPVQQSCYVGQRAGLADA